ncbi:phage tail protein [Acidovorax sp. CF316]|uniref:phage tail protein n=1 Tax=Acidovorax sp. CF316 TaxID=1144317 RepID=UPI00055647D9|nr:tail fiber protein [Acidovorax sp. CF316]
MADPNLGEIRMFAGSFAPVGWAVCDGRQMAIANNDALYALVGTTYGGDGITTFNLPDLRGRAPINQGQGPGLTSYSLGTAAGSESVTLMVQQLPSHTHAVEAGASGTSATPHSAYIGSSTAAKDFRYASATATDNLSTGTLQSSGGSMPHENRSPYLAISFIICIAGIFPSRN